jgi:hypothetical protein
MMIIISSSSSSSSIVLKITKDIKDFVTSNGQYLP